jgi:uncharacterized membrane protein YqhA
VTPLPEPEDELPRHAALALSLRFVIAVAVAGMAVGALLMLWEGAVEIFDALRHTVAADSTRPSVITEVMDATDKFLFGIVLVIFAFTIAFGFLLNLAPETRERLPRWIAPGDVGALKHVFFEVILVYLAVDFVTDIAASETARTWTELVKPLAILLLAAAMRLLVGQHRDEDQH